MFFCLIGLYILSTSNSFLKNIKKVKVFGNKPYPRMERVKMLIEFWITRYKPNLILAVLITSDSGFFTPIHSNHILFIIRTTFIPKIWIPTDQNLSYVSIYLSILWTMGPQILQTQTGRLTSYSKNIHDPPISKLMSCASDMLTFSKIMLKSSKLGTNYRYLENCEWVGSLKVRGGPFSRNDYLLSSQDTL